MTKNTATRNYYAYTFFSHDKTDAKIGSPSPVTGKRSVNGKLRAFALKALRDNYVNEPLKPPQSRVALNIRQAKSLHQGMTTPQFNAYIDVLQRQAWRDYQHLLDNPEALKSMGVKLRYLPTAQPITQPAHLTDEDRALLANEATVSHTRAVIRYRALLASDHYKPQWSQLLRACTRAYENRLIWQHHATQHGARWLFSPAQPLDVQKALAERAKHLPMSHGRIRRVHQLPESTTKHAISATSLNGFIELVPQLVRFERAIGENNNDLPLTAPTNLTNMDDNAEIFLLKFFGLHPSSTLFSFLWGHQWANVDASYSGILDRLTYVIENDFEHPREKAPHKLDEQETYKQWSVSYDY